jgi:acyl-CoA synthetase (AMP-forming)/AMP-acid ligase II
VVSTHAQVRFAVAAIHGRLGYRADDLVYCCLPLSFDYGLYQIFLSCAAGACLVLGGEQDAGPALLGRVRETRATIFPLVPGLASTLARLTERSGTAPERLRLVTNTGAALSGALSRRLRDLMPGLDVVPMFGLTECKRVSIEEPNADLVRPGSAGRPLPDTEVFAVDEAGRRLPAGETGELVVRGPHVMAGYWRAPELTARRFRRDGLGQPVLYTGDLCRLDKAGNVYFVGRDDDIYKQRGFRVSAVEVEAAALDVPGVDQAAVLLPDETHPARLVVTGAVTTGTLAEELAARLERGKLPGGYVVTGRLPRNVNGKTDKSALRAALDDPEARPRGSR